MYNVGLKGIFVWEMQFIISAERKCKHELVSQRFIFNSSLLL